MPELTPLNQAIALATELGVSAATEVQRVPIGLAAGRINHQDVVVPVSFPLFDSSAMDGYALRAADVAAASEQSPASLELVDESRAGLPSARTLQPGQAFTISTGAQVPDGADAVIRVEDTELDADGQRVAVKVAVATGNDIRFAGEDITKGEVAVAAGLALHPGRIALLGGIGISSIQCRKQPTACVIVSGDEVIKTTDDQGSGSTELAPGQVHDVNGVAIPALLRAAGCSDVQVLRAADDFDQTRELLNSCEADLIITTGGVSVGVHDHIPGALESLGANKLAHGIALQPGKPTWIGSLTKNGKPQPVFGLPGNPASALVVATLLVVPCLEAMVDAIPTGTMTARLAQDVDGDSRRLRALRAVAGRDSDGALLAEVCAKQQSHRLRPLEQADLLALLPPAAGVVGAGTEVQVLPIPGAGASIFASERSALSL